MAYLLASDFDGTLLSWSLGGVIVDEDREAIRRFREKGNKFVIVTGRTFQSAFDGFKSANFDDMDCFLCLSGAYCATPNGEEIFDKRQSGKRIPEIAEFFKNTGARYMNIDIGRKSYVHDVGGDMKFWFEELSKEQLSNIETFTSMNVGYATEERSYEVCKMLRSQFGDMITPLQNIAAIDLPPCGINKAVAAGFAAELYNIPRENIYTVGDSYNDLDMVREYNGSAMATGPDELKNAAKRTVSRVHEIIDLLI